MNVFLSTTCIIRAGWIIHPKECLLWIFYKSSSFCAYWVEWDSGFQGLFISVLQRSPMKFVCWIFCFPSEMMEDAVHSADVPPVCLHGRSDWPADTERFLKMRSFPTGRYIPSEQLKTDNQFVTHVLQWFAGTVLSYANLASWILFIVILASSWGKPFLVTGFQSVCKRNWPNLVVLMWPDNLQSGHLCDFLWMIRLVNMCEHWVMACFLLHQHLIVCLFQKLPAASMVRLVWSLLPQAPWECCTKKAQCSSLLVLLNNVHFWSEVIWTLLCPCWERKMF